MKTACWVLALSMIVGCWMSHAQEPQTPGPSPVNRRGSSADGATPRVAPSSVPWSKRNARIVALLEKESSEESIAGLAWLALYPEDILGEDGFGEAGESDVRTSGLLDQASLDSILGNRRFLKVFAQLSALPRAEAGALLFRSLKAALADYTPVYQQRMDRSTQLRRDHLKQTGRHLALSFACTDGPEAKVPCTVEGLRYRVLGLVLIAGNLGAEGMKPVFDEVLSLALSQRRCLYEATDFLPFQQALLIRNWSCDTRIILATGLSAACGDPAKFKSACKALGIQEATRRLTSYDAKVRVGDPTGSAPDFSKGEVLVRFWQVANDAQFDALLKEFGYPDQEVRAAAKPPAVADPAGRGVKAP